MFRCDMHTVDGGSVKSSSIDELPFSARAQGCVLGAAIGDALGHPIEFLDSFAEIRRRFGAEGVKGYELYWEQGGQRFAPYTDDTQMAEQTLLALRRARQERLALDAAMPDLARRFVDWMNNPQGGHRAPGHACIAGCQALAAGKRWDEAGGEHAGGCGSVMRAYPAGLVFCDDLAQAEAWAVAQSKLTHRAPIALAACAALARATALCLGGATTEAILGAMVEAAARHDRGTAKMIEAAIRDAHAGRDPTEVLQRLQGWAAHECIAAAAYVFARHPNSFVVAVLEAANTPGDSDSIATLVGGLVGAREGISSIPQAWVRDLERTTELTELARRTASVIA